jgi:general nucleoside transport system permease protein
VPVLSDLGGVGRALFAQDPIFYASGLLLLATVYLLYRTRWGLAIRAAGEVPFAADAAGVSVRRVRWFATMAAGAMAGLGGAYLAVVELGVFREEMTAGRGFLALAAVIFGRWSAGGVLAAALLFGGTTALQFRLQAQASIPVEVWVLGLVLAVGAVAAILRRPRRRLTAVVPALAAAGACALIVAAPTIDVPAQFWLALPFVFALVVLAGVGSSQMPRSLAIPYNRGER